MYGERHLQAQPVADQCELEVLIGWTWSLRLGAYTIVGPWSRRVFLGGLLGGLGGHRGAPQREAFWEGFWEAVLKPFGSSPARPFRVSRGGFIGVRVAVFRPRFVVGFRPRFVVGFRHQKSPKTIFFFWSPVKMRGRKTATNRGRKTATGVQNASGLAFWADQANCPVAVFRPQILVGLGFRLQFWPKKKWGRGLAWPLSSRPPSVDRGGLAGLP